MLYFFAMDKLFLYAFDSSFFSFSVITPLHIGPTVWITYFAFRLPPEVIIASPVGSPSGYKVFLISLHSSKIDGPPFECIAPSTPKPPIKEEFAALTIACVSASVISPTTKLKVVLPILTFT